MLKALFASWDYRSLTNPHFSLLYTFEPYANITLPIPEIRLIQKQFFWVPFDPSKRSVLYNFSIKSHKQINHLKEFIGEAFNVNKHSFDIVLI